MMNKHFCCPKCGTKQPLKHLLLMSNVSKWECAQCGTLVKPRRMSPYTAILGFISTAIPAYIAIFHYKLPLLQGLLIGLIFGVVVYALVLLYYYITITLEEAE